MKYPSQEELVPEVHGDEDYNIELLKLDPTRPPLVLNHRWPHSYFRNGKACVDYDIPAHLLFLSPWQRARLQALAKARGKKAVAVLSDLLDAALKRG